ncbi:MAG: hypothetical protein M5R36_26410 [Deltaproteobacteria bacterium]|nr:hypothetical protein [Deltaproteobacteria bacterium]
MDFLSINDIQHRNPGRFTYSDNDDLDDDLDDDDHAFVHDHDDSNGRRFGRRRSRPDVADRRCVG